MLHPWLNVLLSALSLTPQPCYIRIARVKTEPPRLIMFLDQKPHERRLQVTSDLKIAVVRGNGTEFVLLNAESSDPGLQKIFGENSPAP